MPLQVLIGGARAGKSLLAQTLATESGHPVRFIATAEARDPEMRRRIMRHKAERPGTWMTIEQPIDVAASVTEAPDTDVVVLDCLTLWVANLVEADRADEEIVELTVSVADLLSSRGGLGIAVTNEVGLGIVPVNDVARRYRDLLGQVNRTFVTRSEEAYLVVAGRRLRLDP